MDKKLLEWLAQQDALQIELTRLIAMASETPKVAPTLCEIQPPTSVIAIAAMVAAAVITTFERGLIAGSETIMDDSDNGRPQED